MRYCKNCGNKVSDSATFCGKCGVALSPQGSSAIQNTPAVSDYSGRHTHADGLTKPVSDDILRKVEGALSLAVMTAGLLLPYVKTSSLVEVASGTTFSFNMASVLSSLGSYGEVASSSMDSALSSSSAGELAPIVNDLKGFGLLLAFVAITAVLGLVGSFVTAARCLENTNKSTRIFSWFIVPYALSSLFVVGGVVSKINSLVTALSQMPSSTLGVGINEICSMTLWPWIVLFGSIACGLVELVRQRVIGTGRIKV